jgi:pimeloyl-ACP methyl ester carboxylesterase
VTADVEKAADAEAPGPALRVVYALGDRLTHGQHLVRLDQLPVIEERFSNAGEGIPDHGLLQRLSAVEVPTLVTNGDSDPMILPHYSYLVAGLVPKVQVKIYPDSANGFPISARRRICLRCPCLLVLIPQSANARVTTVTSS